MKIVEFTRHQAPFAVGERAAVDPATAGRYEKASIGRIVGSVDDKGRMMLDDLTGDQTEGEPGAASGEGDPSRSTPQGRKARDGRQA